MRLLFVWRKIDGVSGGVERMSAAMMNEMVVRGHDVFFLSWDHEGAKNYYEWDERITWRKIGIGDPDQKSSWKTRFQRMFKVREIVSEINPDIIMNFESGVFLSTRLFLAGFKIPFIAAERNAPSRHQYSGNPNKRFGVFASLALADKITVQFWRYIESYPRFLRRKMVAIHNPVLPVEGQAQPGDQSKEQKVLLSVARLSYQKNIDVLIDAFAELKDEFPNWVLKIAGDGDQEARIRKDVKSRNLEERIHILGAVKDVPTLYTSSHLFCLTSRYEGFPNALAESLSYGLPAVGFNQCCGVSDLIKHGENGLLAEGNGNQASLVHALRTLMGDDEQRQKMGEAARESIKPYAPQNIFDELENLFKSMI